MVVVTSLGPPEEGIHHREDNTTTYVNEKSLGKGTLYVSESRVSWVGDRGHQFSLEYPHISRIYSSTVMVIQSVVLDEYSIMGVIYF